jgi:hypothetical protein
VAQLFSLGGFEHMSDILFLIPWTWLLHAVIAGVPLAFIVPLARKRVHWQWWESSVLFVPYGVFVVLMILDLKPKNPLNMFDSISIGFAVVVAALLRVVIGARAERLCAKLLICLLCIFAIIVYFTTSVVRDSM